MLQACHDLSHPNWLLNVLDANKMANLIYVALYSQIKKQLKFPVTTLIKIITKHFCFVFTMISFSRSAIICPQRSWTEYKTVEEGL